MNHVKLKLNGQKVYFLANASLTKPLDVALTNFAGNTLYNAADTK